ncbi:MAG: ATP-binding protein [Pseudomonadota bacterium]
MSFRLKTILGVAGIEAVLLIALVWTSVGFLRDSIEAELLKRADTAATLFATTAKDAVLSTDLASLEAFVSETLKNPDFVYARVVGDGIGVLAAGGDPASLQRDFAIDETIDDVSDGVLDTSAAISEGGILFGRVEIGLSISRLQQILSNAQFEMLSIAGLEMLLVGLFSLGLGAYLTGQLSRLNHAAQRISDGDCTTEVVVKTHDEVGEVGNAFNKMIRNLREANAFRDKYQAELETLNAELEERVVSRTESLLRVNDELRTTQAHLVQSEKLASIGELAAGVAHEINNPMAFVGANIKELSRNVDDLMALLNAYEAAESHISDASQKAEIEALKESLAIAYTKEDLPVLVTESLDGVERVKNIVNALRDFSHGDSGQRQMFDLHRGLDTTLNIAMNKFKDGVEVRREYGDVPEVECIASQIQQVFMNLVVKACQAMEGRGTLSIRTEVCEARAHIHVIDTGCGIDEANLARIFDPFFTTKDVGVGTGLGLSISYGIMRAHQGDLTVHCEPGVGTTFTMILPVDYQEAVLVDEAAA